MGEYTSRLIIIGLLLFSVLFVSTAAIPNAFALPPTAVDDTAETSVGTLVNIDVVANDTDPEGDTPLTIVSVVSPTLNGGTAVIIGASNTIDYTPPSGFRGVDIFDYTIDDGNAGQDIGTVTVVVLGTNGRIAIAPFNAGNTLTELVVVNSDGTNPMTLHSPATFVRDPSFSPDGTEIAFQIQVSGIWKINSDGTGLTQLTFSGADSTPSWSPDGLKILFKGAGFNIKTIPSGGGAATTIITETASVLWPFYSPDGLAIYYTKGSPQNEIFKFVISGAVTSQITTDVTVFHRDPSFSPDGSKIIYGKAAMSGGSSTGLVTINPDGSSPFNIAVGAYNSPSYSPDGDFIAFHGTFSGVDLLRIDSDGSNLIQLFSLSSNVLQPDWGTDPDIPVPNTAPTATPQTVDTNEDTNATITLAGTDPESDPLSFTIESLPTAGALYQTPDGTALGTQITTVPTAVSDASDRVIFVPVANANGTPYATFTFSASDGSLSSSAAIVTINVAAVNDVPSFTGGGNQVVLEDAGAQTVAGHATNLSKGPADEAGQTLSFNIASNSNTGLFSAGPAIDSNGQLTYTPAANANGVANIQVNIMDNGGTANGGVDTSANQGFSITVTAVNDVPSFTGGADQVLFQNQGAQTVADHATNLSKGPADESGQTLSFTVTNDNNGLFSAQPAIDSTGKLTFTSATDTGGQATVSVRIVDNGGTANGGVDTSAVQTFIITIQTPPAAPTLMDAVAKLNVRIDQTWTAPTSGVIVLGGVPVIPPVTDYKVFRQIGGTGDFVLIDIVEGTSPPDTAYSDNPTAAGAADPTYAPLTDGTVAAYKVIAVNVVGDSPQSSSDSATTFKVTIDTPTTIEKWNVSQDLSGTLVGTDYDLLTAGFAQIVIDWGDGTSTTTITPVDAQILATWATTHTYDFAHAGENTVTATLTGSTLDTADSIVIDPAPHNVDLGIVITGTDNAASDCTKDDCAKWDDVFTAKVTATHNDAAPSTGGTLNGLTIDYTSPGIDSAVMGTTAGGSATTSMTGNDNLLAVGAGVTTTTAGVYTLSFDFADTTAYTSLGNTEDFGITRHATSIDSFIIESTDPFGTSADTTNCQANPCNMWDDKFDVTVRLNDNDRDRNMAVNTGDLKGKTIKFTGTALSTALQGATFEENTVAITGEGAPADDETTTVTDKVTAVEATDNDASVTPKSGPNKSITATFAAVGDDDYLDTATTDSTTDITRHIGKLSITFIVDEDETDDVPTPTRSAKWDHPYDVSIKYEDLSRNRNTDTNTGELAGKTITYTGTALNSALQTASFTGTTAQDGGNPTDKSTISTDEVIAVESSKKAGGTTTTSGRTVIATILTDNDYLGDDTTDDNASNLMKINKHVVSMFLKDVPTIAIGNVFSGIGKATDVDQVAVPGVLFRGTGDLSGESISFTEFREESHTGSSDLDFNDNGVSDDTIVRASGSWITDGFEAGDIIEITSTSDNNGELTIKSLTATDITVETGSLVDEQNTSGTVVGGSVALNLLEDGILTEAVEISVDSGTEEVIVTECTDGPVNDDDVSNTCSANGIHLLQMTEEIRLGFERNPSVLIQQDAKYVTISIEELASGVIKVKSLGSDGVPETQITVTSGLPDIQEVTMFEPDGVDQIRVDFLGGSPTVSISRMQISDNGNPIVIADFAITDEIPTGTHTTPFVVHDGIFLATALVDPDETKVGEFFDISLTATMAASDDYETAVSNTIEFHTEINTLISAGVGGTASLEPDTGTGFVVTTCSRDNDKDGACNGWEKNGLPFLNADGVKRRIHDNFDAAPVSPGPHNPLIGAGKTDKDIWLEIDWMKRQSSAISPSDPYNPRTNSMNAVVNVFRDNGDIRLHLKEDEAFAFEQSINVWTDFDHNFGNDFNSIKARHFGDWPEERSILDLSGPTIDGWVQQTTSVASTATDTWNLTIDDIALTTHDRSAADDDKAKGRIIVNHSIEFDVFRNLLVPDGASAIFTANPGGSSLFIDSIDATADFDTTDGSFRTQIISVTINFHTDATVGTHPADPEDSVGEDLELITVPFTTSNSIDDANVSSQIATPGSPRVVTTLTEALAQVFHYAIFVHSVGPCGPSGVAEVNGNDFVVALGCGFSSSQSGFVDGLVVDVDSDGNIDTTDASRGSTIQQKGTLMHELGHNLGLLHGGPFEIEQAGDPSGLAVGTQPPDNDKNCKPNYMSVMSYSRQLNNYIGSNKYELDYSFGNYPTLDESALVEGAGLENGDTTVTDFSIGTKTSATANVAKNDLSAVIYFDVDGAGKKKIGFTTLAVPEVEGTIRAINWDNSETGTVSNDINNFGFGECDGTGSIYSDYDDWGNLDLNFRDEAGGSFDGSPFIDAEVDVTFSNLDDIRFSEGGFYDGPLGSLATLSQNLINDDSIVPIQLEIFEFDPEDLDFDQSENGPVNDLVITAFFKLITGPDGQVGTDGETVLTDAQPMTRKSGKADGCNIKVGGEITQAIMENNESRYKFDWDTGKDLLIPGTYAIGLLVEEGAVVTNFAQSLCKPGNVTDLGELQKILSDTSAEFHIGSNEDPGIYPDDGSTCELDTPLRDDCDEVYSIQVNIFVTKTPKPPTDLTATATADDEVTTSWVAPVPVPDEVLFYELTRATDVDFTVVTLLSTEFEADPLLTTFVDSPLVSGTYFYKVRANNVNGFGEFSNTDSATPGGAAGSVVIKVDNIDMTGKPVKKVKDLRATPEILLLDSPFTPIEGATIRIQWFLDDVFFLEEIGLTGANGKHQFQISNADDGTWHTTVIEVIPPTGFSWDGVEFTSFDFVKPPPPP